MSKINTKDFYSKYDGHKIMDLNNIIGPLRSYNEQNKNRSVIFLAGDSSLDNKHWPFNDPIEKLLCNKQPINGYESVLEGDNCVPDVAYQINQTLIENELNNEYVCINTAIEATKLEERFDMDSKVRLLEQDQFICDNITNDDILIVSVSGNDLALGPTAEIVEDMRKYVKAFEDKNYKEQNDLFGETGIFYGLFVNKMSEYIKKLCSKKNPKKVIICMIYFVSISFFKNLGSGRHWAKKTIDIFKYTSNPDILKSFIIKCHELIKINYLINSGINIFESCPLYEVLNELDNTLYLSGVEPSIIGGKLMAERFVDQIKIHKYIRSNFHHMGSNIDAYGYSMLYFRNEFDINSSNKFKELLYFLLDETHKLNKTKKDKYYYNQLKRYINIILKEYSNIDDIDLFIKNEAMYIEKDNPLELLSELDFSWGDEAHD
jgi:hypothetical protein